MDLLAAKIEVAVFEPDLLGVVLLAGDRHRQLGGGRLDLDVAGLDLDFARRQLGVHRLGAARDDRAGDGDHRFDAERFEQREHRASGGRDDLGDPVMIAKVDEQHPAVVALAVNPPRQADGLANIGGAQLGAIMGSVGVHAGSVLAGAVMGWKSSAALQWDEPLCQPAGPPLLPVRSHANPSPDYHVRRARPLVERLSKQPFVAVDTEFMRENTYWPDLCLIQVASADEAAAIDPKSPDIV